MRPEKLKTKIFLDSGSTEDTKIVLDKLGFLDGQTTNPSLFVKNPDIQTRLSSGEKFSKTEINEAYKKIIRDIREIIPKRSVSIEVYADENTTLDEILDQARAMNHWVDKPHIKLPITEVGLEAAHILSAEGMKINMTLVFSEGQAAAVYSATKVSNKGDIFLSPFIGRLDDIGVDGLGLISNIQKLYKDGDNHVEILMASVRNIEHFMNGLEAEVDIMTVPMKILLEWHENGMPLKSDNNFENNELNKLEYKGLELDKNYKEYNIQHDLTDKGLKKFADDWNDIIEK